MRQALHRNKDKKFHVFNGIVEPNRPYGRQLLKNVQIMDESGNNVVGNIDHVLVAAKPFKQIKPGSRVRFTGKISDYVRSDGSKDYQIIVNRVTAWE